jgi:3',5'-cyclic AMP phosphodiesterase CpdA
LRLLAHLSDLHFGRVDQTIVRALVAKLHEVNPDIVVVSGDLTQRARESEFREAQAFLAALARPQIIVPGNHDLPLYNVLARWLTPFERYRRYICDDLEPFYIDAEIAIAGINSARANTFKNGRISPEQIRRIRLKIDAYGAAMTQIVVIHHPFHAQEVGDRSSLIRRASMAMEAFARIKVDLILSGHLHRSTVADGAERYGGCGRPVLLVQAGTAISTRRRGELNAFNLIHIDFAQISVQRLEWNEKSESFAITHSDEFFRQGDVWSRSAHGDQVVGA